MWYMVPLCWTRARKQTKACSVTLETRLNISFQDEGKILNSPKAIKTDCQFHAHRVHNRHATRGKRGRKSVGNNQYFWPEMKNIHVGEWLTQVFKCFFFFPNAQKSSVHLLSAERWKGDNPKGKVTSLYLKSLEEVHCSLTRQLMHLCA